MTDFEAPPPKVNPWVLTVVVTMATFMEVLDTTIVNVSLPHIAGNLSASQDESTWVLTSYLVANAIILPISGWLSNMFGRKRFYMTCVALFAGSSFLCGFAPNLTLLVIFRILQGLGGGGLQPSEQAILVDTFPIEKRGMAFAASGVALILAPIIGPTLGGWITDNYSWRWCFYINVPIGALSLYLSNRLVHDPPHARRMVRRQGFKIDFPGLGLIAVGLGSLQMMLDKGNQLDWFGSSMIRTLAVVGVVCLLCAIAWEMRQPDPVVDLRLLRYPTFASASALMFCLGFVMFGATVLIPLLLQTLMGYSAMQAGLILSPGGLVVMVMMPIVGMLVSRIQPKWLIVFGMGVNGLALLWMTHFSLQMDFTTALLARSLQAFGIAFVFIPVNTVAYSQLPPGKNNNASALINLMRNLGASFGIALSTSLVLRHAQMHQAMLVARMTPYDQAYRSALKMMHGLAQGNWSTLHAAGRPEAMIYGMLQRQAAMLAYNDIFWMLGLMSLLIIPIPLLMRKMNLAGAPKGAH